MSGRVLAGIGGLVMVAGLTGLARPAAADPISTLRIVFEVRDHARIPTHIVTRAKDEMTRIYRDACVNIMWRDPVPGASQRHAWPSAATADPGFALVVLPREMTDQLVVATEALGGAAGTREQRGRMAYVFYDRVERVARTHLRTGRRTGAYDFDDVIVLAHAMAHEIGHLLLPYGHSAAGLMRANWDAADLQRAVRGQLNFTPQQAQSIRAKLLTLQGGESASNTTGDCQAKWGEGEGVRPR
jgi:hypothetical protein